ncbi:MAG: O-methyltransferase [Chloroflexota bacterium]|nr:O-methyltransferase [Chloroflexota bacterium]
MSKKSLQSKKIRISNNGRIELPIVQQSPEDPLSNYALDMLRMRPTNTRLGTVLLEMEVMAAREQVPIIGPLEGAVIQALLQLRQPPPRKVLDIGTAIGYSALCLARTLPQEAQIISIEIDPQRAGLARHFIEKAGLQSRIQVIVGDVMELLPKIDNEFDIIFQDVIKHVYFGADASLALQLLESCLDHLADNGVLLGDNAFCMGEVLHNRSDELPAQIVGIQAYNKKVAAHPQLNSVIIPVRDGLWVSHKRKRRAA